ncbi:MAG: hypothetical protein QOD86_634 [Miltoncostaeaceae bacterium]|jgi:hypothetical protein|nr:hypothetical protein [Miltoncostaeaceae bacterium]
MGRFRQGDEATEARRRAAAGDVRAFEQRAQQVGRLLAEAHGYLVRGPRGEPIGRVAGLSYGIDDRWPRALIMRPHGLRGLWSSDTWELPFSAVGDVISAHREVRVRSEGRPPAAPAARSEPALPAEARGGWPPPRPEGSRAGASPARSSSGNAH